MKIVIGNDHSAVELKNIIKAHLEEKGYEVMNVGTDTSDSCDYPVYGEKVGRAVASGEADLGIAICGTGVGISLDALTSRAALLSSVSLEAPAHVVGRDTAECLRSGVLYGAAAMLDGLCDRMEQELGYPCRVIATGGLAGLVGQHCRRQVECSDTLLLEGLKEIYLRAGAER